MSNRVTISFLPRWREAMLSGRKVCTFRTKQMAEPWDTFEAFGAIFEVTAVLPDTVGNVAETCYHVEGCASPTEFRAVYRQIHPKRHGDDVKGWLHVFRRVEADHA